SAAGVRAQPALARELRQGARDVRGRETHRGASAVSAAKKEAAPKADKAPNQERLIAVLIAPHITEKTSLAMQNANTYSFRVRRDSSKPDVKAAVELMFGVKVSKVNLVNETGKSRRFGKLQGRTQDIKKAYVRLAPGQTIDYEAKIKA